MKNKNDELNHEIKTGLEISVSVDNPQLEELMKGIASEIHEHSIEAMDNFPVEVSKATSILAGALANIGLATDKSTQKAYLDMALNSIRVATAKTLELEQA